MVMTWYYTTMERSLNALRGALSETVLFDCIEIIQ
jgi:hypothetical protein